MNDVALKVFSSYNNWPKRALGNGVEEPIEQSVVFVGVALLPIGASSEYIAFHVH